MDERACTRCGETRPLAQFAKDSRTKSGVRAVCKPCDRAATKARRDDARIGRRPGALILVPQFPAPPEETSPTEAHPTTGANPDGAGPTSYADAAERFIAALDPPAGDADALLVRSLRGLADLADRYGFGADVVKDTNALVASMVRVQRELAATRAARAKSAAPEAKPAPRSAANY